MPWVARTERDPYPTGWQAAGVLIAGLAESSIKPAGHRQRIVFWGRSALARVCWGPVLCGAVRRDLLSYRAKQSNARLEPDEQAKRAMRAYLGSVES